jgi:hypothetical protein
LIGGRTTGVVVLALLAFAFEALGLIAALWGLNPLRSVRRWAQRRIAWLRRVLGLSHPVEIQVHPGTGVAFGGNLNLQVGRAPATTLEERVSRLETITDDLNRRIDDEVRDLREAIPQVAAQHAAEVRAALEGVTASLGQELRISKERARWALALLLAGAVCSAAANIVGAVC